jgi:uncharacterized membrane protein YccC
LLVKSLGHRDPLWAMISVVIVSDAELGATVKAFRGCAVGLTFLWVLGPANWSILLAMSAAVLFSMRGGLRP